jgi:hypothetical protein
LGNLLRVTACAASAVGALFWWQGNDMGAAIAWGVTVLSVLAGLVIWEFKGPKDRKPR